MSPHSVSPLFRRPVVLLLALLCLQVVPLRAEVILQYFESTWDEMYQRIPEISEAGYDAVWTPSPCKAPEAGTITWGNVGYSLYDRFDLGDTPQRGTLATRYGTRGDLRNMVDNLHDCDVKIYPDMIINHNGNGPDYRTYPGMMPNDFHIWQDASQPGGWKRPARMSAYDDISGGQGGTLQQELVSLIDLVTEPDGRFSSNAPNYTAEPAPFIRHPGRPDLYPYGPPSTENVRQMMNRWAAWLGNAMDYDGFRIDAAKHVVREFYGSPGNGFLDAAQYNFHQRRGYTYDNTVPDLNKNDIQRHDMIMFSEIFSGASSTFDYWRQGNVRMRYLDFPQKINLLDNAFNNNNLGVLATLGTALDPTDGVMFVQSHDQPAPNKLTLAYAYLLMHTGVPIVYFSGNNISWSDYNTKTWMKPGIGDALGDYDNAITNLVYISNQFARGREWNRWADSGYYAFERYTDTNSSATIDSGESTLLVALNNTGSDVTHTLTTAFPNGTVLHDYTGHNGNDLTVSGGQVSVTVPANAGQGYVCYAPYNA
ncbi:MAG: alpha-amylase family glycosyl hydrolase, partial [Verrucomicrobiota bacterium]